MKDFKKGGFGGKRFGGGRPQFGADRGRPEMHSATCAECGNACEVPFRPDGSRPIYCRECFGTKDPGPRPFAGRGEGGRDFKPRDSFRPRQDFKPRYDRAPVQSSTSDAGVSALKREIETLSGKIDRLVTALESRTQAEGAVAKATAIKGAIDSATKPTKKKKAPKKK